MFTIPPGQPAYTYQAWCPSACTQAMYPPTGINVIGAMLHAHTAAKAIVLRHYRDEAELQPVISEPYYDFDLQSFADLEHRNLTLLPGDTIRMDCTYDTTYRTAPTPFGISTQEEMCLAYVMYWPKINTTSLRRCLSANYSGTIMGVCGNNASLINGYQPPPFTSYTPPPCPYVAPDPTRTTPTKRSTLVAPNDYEHSEVMDPDGKYTLHWTADRTTLELRAAVEVQTTGWVGLGISEMGMDGADVLIAYVDDNTGDLHFKDRFVYSKTAVQIDTYQDYYDITGGQVESSSSNTLIFGLSAGAVYIIGALTGVALSAAVVAIYWFRCRKSRYAKLSEDLPLSTT